MKTGEQLILELEAGYTWAVNISDLQALNLLSEKTADEHSGYLARFEALQAGQIELLATGNPLCLQADPPCGMPSVLFMITVVVE